MWLTHMDGKEKFPNIESISMMKNDGYSYLLVNTGYMQGSAEFSYMFQKRQLGCVLTRWLLGQYPFKVSCLTSLSLPSLICKKHITLYWTLTCHCDQILHRKLKEGRTHERGGCHEEKVVMEGKNRYVMVRTFKPHSWGGGRVLPTYWFRASEISIYHCLKMREARETLSIVVVACSGGLFT